MKTPRRIARKLMKVLDKWGALDADGQGMSKDFKRCLEQAMFRVIRAEMEDKP